MALARILVDGYSLLHNWPELAPGRPRHSARARDELIHVLTRYHDATGEPIAVFLMARARGLARRQLNRTQRWKFCFRVQARPPIK
ncbi:MAG TPA: NYN domain-containing protein [Verrucomicrobiae bacterium]|nr:NYN domain-containing protein [Verrucomicrobiae bacterium]